MGRGGARNRRRLLGSSSGIQTALGAVRAAHAFQDANLRPVINGPAELAEWDAFVAAQNWQGGAALHVDTGMNRLGITADEAAALAPRAQTENHGITLLMSHLACAEIADHGGGDPRVLARRSLRRARR